MPSHFRRPIQINLDGEVVELSHEAVKFYLKETQKKVARRQAIQKFYENIRRHFANENFFSIE